MELNRYIFKGSSQIYFEENGRVRWADRDIMGECNYPSVMTLPEYYAVYIEGNSEVNEDRYTSIFAENIREAEKLYKMLEG